MKHHLEKCPGCGSSKLHTLMDVTDYFLSQEEFKLMRCESCKLVSTSPRPSIGEIGSYYKSSDYVSHSSTKKGLVNRLYAVVRNFTLKQKVALIRSLTPGRELLDIGAGTGHFLLKAKQAGYKVIGLEPDEDARAVAFKENDLVLDDLSQLAHLPTESFDVVTMWHVLEHVYHLQDDLHTITALLKDGGVLVIAVPNYKSFDAQHYGKYWAAYDVPRHLYHFAPDSLIPLVEKFGLTHEKMLPMKFDSYYVSMLSEKYKQGSLLSGLVNGWRSNLRARNGSYSSQIYIFRK